MGRGPVADSRPFYSTPQDAIADSRDNRLYDTTSCVLEGEAAIRRIYRGVGLSDTCYLSVACPYVADTDRDTK